METSFSLLEGLPEAGADLIEIGMPFSDPMADGPVIQASSLRALKAKMTVSKILDMVRRFRQTDEETPIILMGYYNPIYAYGAKAFLQEAGQVGVDGLIIVDLPPEEEELCLLAIEAGLNFIYLATPTSDEKRLAHIVRNASGFVYYVSITGITGTTSASGGDVSKAVAKLRRQTELPIVVGFGIKTREAVEEIAQIADGVVVGSAVVAKIVESLDMGIPKGPELVKRVLDFVKHLSAGTFHGSRQGVA